MNDQTAKKDNIPGLQVFEPKDIFENDGKNGKRLYVVIHKKVYDVTDFDHPGGKDAFLFESEEDMDFGGEFDQIHDSKTKKSADKYLIGTLKID